MASAPHPSDKFIPWYIVLFFVVLTFVFGGFAYVAKTTHTGLVTDEAYEKGLAYNSTIEKAAAQDALGYVSDIGFKDNIIYFSLVDATAQPITNAHVKLWLYRPVHDGDDVRLDMTEVSKGQYKATIAPPEQGMWEIRIHAATPAGDYQASKRVVL